MKGRTLDHAVDYEEAIEAFDKALEIKSDYIAALYNKGNVLDHIGNVDAAVETYDHIIRLKPDAYEAWNNKGLALAKIPDRRNEALEAYDKAIAINPKYYEAWINKGNCFVRIRKYQRPLMRMIRPLRYNLQNMLPGLIRGLPLQISADTRMPLMPLIRRLN